jgi:quercetin dioxygenase-like cupin family protein
MTCSRRDLALLLPAAMAAQEKRAALPSKTFPYEDLPVRVSGQNRQRAVLNGVTHSGFPVEVHLTELGPGQAPHAPHRHVHEEMVLLQNGLLDVTIEGKTTRLTAGSVAYVASNDLHGWRNPGPERTQYFVVALGQGPKK